MNIIKRIEPKVCELRERISIYSNLLVSCSRCKRTPELRHLMHPSQNLLYINDSKAVCGTDCEHGCVFILRQGTEHLDKSVA